jgi:hypothetical protein
MSLSFTITFSKPIYKNINILYFIENNNNIYYDGSHMNYIYIHKIDNIDYTFHGFYKDDFFIIIFDSFDNNLSINIEMKYVIILKLEWILKEIKMQNINVVNTENMINYKIDTYLLKNRKNINKSSLLTIEDYLRLNDYTIITSIINSTKINKDNLLNKIKNIFSFIQ